jgi:hypothetical protein
MASEHVSFDVEGIPGLAALAEQVQRDRKPRALKRDGETLAYLEPLESKPLTSKGTKRQTTRKSSKAEHIYLLGLLEIAESGDVPRGGPTDVSTNKHKYLAEAYAAEASSTARE